MKVSGMYFLSESVNKRKRMTSSVLDRMCPLPVQAHVAAMVLAEV